MWLEVITQAHASPGDAQQQGVQRSALTCVWVEALEGCLLLQGGSRDVKPVGNGCGQVGHDLQPHPPVGLHGVVAVLWARGRECFSDVIQDQRHILQATVHKGLHHGHVASEVLAAIVLPHRVGGPAPQGLGLLVDAGCCQDAGGCHEVTGLDEDDTDPPAVHLLPQAVGESCHPKLGNAVAGARWTHHASQHACDIHHTA